MSKRRSRSVHPFIWAVVSVVTIAGCRQFSADTAKPSTGAPPAQQAPTTPADSTGKPSAFPSPASTGVKAGTILKRWTASSTSRSKLPTTTVGGTKFKLIDGYLFDSGKSGRYLSIDDPYVIIRNSRFVTSGQVSNTSAMVQGEVSNRTLIIEGSEFDGGPYFQRGVQSDTADMYISRSRFHNTGESAIEKNDRSASSSLVVSDCYLTNDKGWPKGQHVDGVQVGGAKDVSIHHNTVLNQPYGRKDGDTVYASNSALGLWAELGNVSGSVTVDNNLLAGGGRTIYLEQKAPYTWQGPVKVLNNTFDTRFGSHAAIWGVLYPTGLPADLTWSGNHFSGGRAISLPSAMKTYS